MADEPIEGNTVEPTDTVSTDVVPAAAPSLTSLSDYWKLDAWDQGYVVASEAGIEGSQVKGQVNPYTFYSDRGSSWRVGHRQGGGV